MKEKKEVESVDIENMERDALDRTSRKYAAPRREAILQILQNSDRALTINEIEQLLDPKWKTSGENKTTPTVLRRLAEDGIIKRWGGGRHLLYYGMPTCEKPKMVLKKTRSYGGIRWGGQGLKGAAKSKATN